MNPIKRLGVDNMQRTLANTMHRECFEPCASKRGYIFTYENNIHKQAPSPHDVPEPSSMGAQLMSQAYIILPVLISTILFITLQVVGQTRMLSFRNQIQKLWDWVMYPIGVSFGEGNEGRLGGVRGDCGFGFDHPSLHTVHSTNPREPVDELDELKGRYRTSMKSKETAKEDRLNHKMSEQEISAFIMTIDNSVEDGDWILVAEVKRESAEDAEFETVEYSDSNMVDNSDWETAEDPDTTEEDDSEWELFEWESS